MNCQVRISRLWNDTMDLITELDKYSKETIIYSHEADENVNRTHFHMFMFGVSRSEDTIRNYIRKYIEDKSDWSFSKTCGKKPDVKPIDYDAISYGSKGRLDPVYIKNIPQEIIDDRKAKGYDVKKDKLKVRNGKIVIERSEELRKKTDIEMIEEISNRINKNNTRDNLEIAQEIVDVWKKNKKRGHARLLNEWIDAVKMYSPGHESEWISNCVAKYESLMKVR